MHLFMLFLKERISANLVRNSPLSQEYEHHTRGKDTKKQITMDVV